MRSGRPELLQHQCCAAVLEPAPTELALVDPFYGLRESKPLDVEAQRRFDIAHHKERHCLLNVGFGGRDGHDFIGTVLTACADAARGLTARPTRLAALSRSRTKRIQKTILATVEPELVLPMARTAPYSNKPINAKTTAPPKNAPIMCAVVHARRAAHKTPDVGVEAFKLLLQPAESLRVLDRTGHLQSIAHDAGIFQEAFDARRSEASHAGRIEFSERFAIGFSLLENRFPTEAGLRSLQRQKLEVNPVVVNRDAPLPIVVRDHQRRSSPAAANEVVHF